MILEFAIDTHVIAQHFAMIFIMVICGVVTSVLVNNFIDTNHETCHQCITNIIIVGIAIGFFVCSMLIISNNIVALSVYNIFYCVFTLVMIVNTIWID